MERFERGNAEASPCRLPTTARSTLPDEKAEKWRPLLPMQEDRRQLTVENRRWEFRTYSSLARSSMPLFMDSIGWFPIWQGAADRESRGGTGNVDENKTS